MHTIFTVPRAYFQMRKSQLGVKVWSCAPVPCGGAQCSNVMHWNRILRYEGQAACQS